MKKSHERFENGFVHGASAGAALGELAIGTFALVAGIKSGNVKLIVAGAACAVVGVGSGAITIASMKHNLCAPKVDILDATSEIIDNVEAAAPAAAG